MLKKLESKYKELKVMFFIKIFEKKEYADRFIEGNIHLNRLSHFKNMEDKSFGRGDRHEGPAAWFQAENIRIELKKDDQIIKIPSSNIAGPVVASYTHLQNYNVLCLFSGIMHPNDDSVDGLKNLQERLTISENLTALGAHAVIIGNAKEFIQRLDESVKSLEYGLSRGLVMYFDPDTYNGNIDYNLAAFLKSNKYENQHEYRFAVDTRTEGSNPLCLSIGDISDIAYYVPSKDINSCITVTHQP